MTSAWAAALIALFMWWFSTGAILMAVRWSDRAGPSARLWLLLAAAPLLALGFWLFLQSRHESSPTAAYQAFMATLLIWGWIELAFLAGVVTGPNSRPCPGGVPEWERFIRAWGTIAYHEMLLIAALLTMGLLAWDAVNPIGFWTFAILFFARVSAKLNLYLGVPRINTEFLPSRLTHLESYFRITRLNWLFPISVTALSFAVACWLERLYVADDTALTVGFALLSSITALALIEHWLMVLPLPDAKLWRWMLPAPTSRKDALRGQP